MTMIDLAVLLATFTGVVAFVYIGVQMFSQGWESYDEKYMENAEGDLESALLTIPPQHLTYLCFLSGLLGFGLCYLMFRSLFGSVMMSCFATLLPKMALNRYKIKRQKKFAEQLVDALVAMSNSLKAGYALPKAMEALALEAANPMGQEMRIVIQEMRLGDTIVQALRNLHSRMPNDDLDLVITAISISQDLGGNLTEVFERIAETIRARQEIEGKIDALTSQGKAQGFIVGMLPLFLGLAVNYIDPKLFKPMYTTIAGWVLIGVVIILEMIGMAIIKKIVTIRV